MTCPQAGEKEKDVVVVVLVVVVLIRFMHLCLRIIDDIWDSREVHRHSQRSLGHRQVKEVLEWRQGRGRKRWFDFFDLVMCNYVIESFLQDMTTREWKNVMYMTYSKFSPVWALLERAIFDTQTLHIVWHIYRCYANIYVRTQPSCVRTLIHRDVLLFCCLSKKGRKKPCLIEVQV